MANVKNGLSYFDEGGDVEIPVTAAKSKTGLTPSGKIGLDQTETASILQNMQALIDQRTGPMSTFLGGLQEASAWGAGGAEGPSAALTAFRRQKQLEQADTLGMQEKMAAYRAAQAKAERDAKLYASVAPGAGGGAGSTQGFTDQNTGVYIPPEQLQREKLAGPDALAVRQEYLKTAAAKRAERDASVELDKLVPYAIGGREEMITLRDAIELAKKNPSLPRNQKILAQAETLTPTAPATGTNVPLSVRNNNPGNIVDTATGKIKVFATPEEGDKAFQKDLELKISGQSPVVKERFGSQVGGFMSPALLAETWSPATATGNTPESTQNYAKAIANAVGIEPTAQIPNTPEAIGKAKAAMAKFEAGAYQPTTTAPTTTAPTTTAPKVGGREPTLEEIRKDQATRGAYEQGVAKGQAENIVKDEAAFRLTTEPKSVVERKTSAERVVDLVQNNPKAVGILTSKGTMNALATIARDGLNTPSGAIGIKTLEDALVLAVPGQDQKTINARKEIAQNLARGALEASKLSQGQGSVSDFERTMFEKIAGSLADTPELLIKRQKMLIARADLDKELGSMYRSMKVPGKPTDYEAFTSTPKFTQAVDAYEEKLRSILSSEESFGKQGPASGKTDTGISFKVITPAKQ